LGCVVAGVAAAWRLSCGRSSGPAHGYAVVQEIQRRSGGVFELPEGTIYPALHRLEQAGLLAASPHISTRLKANVAGVSRPYGPRSGACHVSGQNAAPRL
jgi:hypothetical protein